MFRVPTRESWWLTATVAVWVAALLASEWAHQWWLIAAFSAAFAGATWLSARWPWVGVGLTAVGVVALGAMGLPVENAAPLGPIVVALLCTGYLCAPFAGVWAVPVLLAAVALSTRWEIPSIAFGAALLFLPWWFGYLVRRRDGARQRAASDAAQLAAIDPASQARLAADSERQTVASDALAAVENVIGDMTRTAADARVSLDAEQIAAIHRGGEVAARRLRSLLVVLREQSDAENDAGAGESSAHGRQALPNVWRLVRDAWPGALVLLDVLLTPLLMVAVGDATEPTWPSGPLLLVVAAVVVAIALRNRYTVVSLLGALTVVAIGMLVGVVDLEQHGLWLAITSVALSWSAGRNLTRRVAFAWAVFAVGILTLVAVYTPDNIPIQIVAALLPLGASLAWAGQLTAESVHLSEAAGRRAELHAIQREAVARERLELSRDLHDAASHAVGAMMMQAKAARVLQTRDPDTARAALDAVIEIGSRAADELRAISAPAEVPGARAETEAPVDLVGELATLVTEVQRTGSRVTTRTSEAVGLAEHDVRLALRVVREGLQNAARHAPGSDVTVEIGVDQEQRVVVDVTNTLAAGDRVREEAARGAGLGLTGLRELIEERRGVVTTSSTGEGYELRASFPRSVDVSEVATS